MLAVLEVTQRVPPTCIIKTDFTYHFVDRSGCRRGKKDCHCDCAAFDVGSSRKFATDVCSRHSTKHLHHHLSKKNRIVEKDKSVQNRMVKTYQCQKYKYTFLQHELDQHIPINVPPPPSDTMERLVLNVRLPVFNRAR
jgi:hypothetical protein